MIWTPRTILLCVSDRKNEKKEDEEEEKEESEEEEERKEKENESRLPICKLLPKGNLAQQPKHIFVSLP